MKKMVAGLVAGLLIGSAGMAAAASTPTVQAMLVKFSFVVDGKQQKLQHDPLLYKGTTYLPVREMSELLGYEVGFDNKKKSVELNPPKETGSAAGAAASAGTKTGDKAATIPAENWISLKELKNFNITVSGDLVQTLTLISGPRVVEISLPEKQQGRYTAPTAWGKVELEFTDKGILIDIKSLETAGFFAP